MPGPATQERRRAERRGRSAEILAIVLLTLKGYRLLARRVRTPVGEIDLVMRRGRVLAFVEVKRRPDLARAAESIGPRQRRRIARAAEWWLARRPQFGDIEPRFDAVLVGGRGLPRHLAGALEP